MAAVTLTRHPDGRHAVLDAEGNLLGLHNSLASAQRQVQDYYPEVAQELGQAKAKQSSPKGGIPVPQGGAPAPGQVQAMGGQAPNPMDNQAANQMAALQGQHPGAAMGQQPGGGMPAPMAPHPLDTLGTSQHAPAQQAANVALVKERMGGAWGSQPATAPQLMQAYAAFHQQKP